MKNHLQTSANGSVFGIESRRTSNIGLRANAVPATRALELTSNDGHGYLSAHRSLAKSLGWPTKAAELRSYRDGAMIVTTYWLPPTTTSTSELKEI